MIKEKISRAGANVWTLESFTNSMKDAVLAEYTAQKSRGNEVETCGDTKDTFLIAVLQGNR